MKLRFAFALAIISALTLTISAQAVFVQKYTTREDLTKVFVANLRAIPNTKFNLRSSDKSGGTIQAVRLVRNQELGSLFILITQQDPSTALVEATFTRNGGWFGGGDPEEWAAEFADQLKLHLPDIVEVSDDGFHDASDASRFERLVAFKQHEVIALGISRKGMTVSSVEVIRWPEDAALRKQDKNGEARGEIVVVFSQTNRSGKDYKCTYDIALLDGNDTELGTGRRVVGIEDGEVNDTARVGIGVRLADVARVAKLRIRAVPEPDV